MRSLAYELLGGLDEGTHFITKLVLEVDECPGSRLDLTRRGRLFQLDREQEITV